MLLARVRVGGMWRIWFPARLMSETPFFRARQVGPADFNSLAAKRVIYSYYFGYIAGYQSASAGATKRRKSASLFSPFL